VSHSATKGQVPHRSTLPQRPPTTPCLPAVPPLPALPCCHPQNRYLIILYYNSTRHKQKLSLKEQEAELRGMQERHGVDGEQHGKPKK
jgi:hypothetical protein